MSYGETHRSWARTLDEQIRHSISQSIRQAAFFERKTGRKEKEGRKEGSKEGRKEGNTFVNVTWVLSVVLHVRRVFNVN